MSLRLKRSIGTLVTSMLTVTLLVAVLLALFPAMVEAQAEDKGAPSVVVRFGDSLWSISEQRLGPNATPQRIAKGTEQIHALNRGRIGADPNLIFVGQEFRVPPVMSEPPTEAIRAHVAAGKTTEAAKEVGPRDRTAGKMSSKATAKAPGTATSGADIKGGKASAPVAERETKRRVEAVRLPDEPAIAPVPAIRIVDLSGNRAEGLRLLGLCVLLLTLLVTALIVWKLLMRHTHRRDAGEPIPDMFVSVEGCRIEVVVDPDMLRNPIVHDTARRLAKHLVGPRADVWISCPFDKPESSPGDQETVEREVAPEPLGQKRRVVRWGSFTKSEGAPAANGGIWNGTTATSATAAAAVARWVRKAKAKPRNGLALGAHNPRVRSASLLARAPTRASARTRKPLLKKGGKVTARFGPRAEEKR